VVVVVYVHPSHLDELLLERIAEKVRAGRIVVYPTDTVYGVGSNPFLEEAVLRVYRVKKRPLDKPLPVLVSSVEAAEEVVYMTREARLLAEAFWPGALTLVLRARENVPGVLHAGTGKVGVRMPDHSVALSLIDKCCGALVGTSANIHGRPAPRNALEALEQLGEGVDYVIDSGPSPGGVPSTVIDLAAWPPRLLREGPVSASEIERVLGARIVRS